MAEHDEMEPRWTGHELFDVDGEKIGTIEDVLVGDATGRLKWLVVETGLLGMKKVFVPLTDVRRSADHLSVPQTKDRVKSAPHVEDSFVPTEDEKQQLCQYYGMVYTASVGGPVEGCQETEDKRPGG